MDKWYVLHVKTGNEKAIKTEITNNILGAFGVVPTENCIVPGRLMFEKWQGTCRTVEKTLIPGYVFVRINMSTKNYYALTNIPGVIRILGEPFPEEMERILELTDENDLIGASEVFAEGDSIKVLNGPLIGLEGLITKIDKRKGRAKVKISLFGRPTVIELSVIMLQNLNTKEPVSAVT